MKIKVNESKFWAVVLIVLVLALFVALAREYGGAVGIFRSAFGG